MKCELLAPAGSYEIAIEALKSGADAIYLATKQYGARAYAKNLSLEELEKVVNYANVLNKKIYVTCNTLIKDDELADVYDYLNTIYKIGVHGVITTDFAIINYVINSLVDMECHISTQVGVKSLEDVNFFTKLNAKRCVLARECDLSIIKKIKQNSKMPLEVFIHGALCVSYSGNCYFSSLLTLRSGNRGRCAQNCRREYSLIKNDKVIYNKANLLSMKDLNTFSSIKDLVELFVDSLKIEGRMKDVSYVKTLVETYRKKLDDLNYQTDILNKIFHREYTKGFLNNEDRGNVVSSNRAGNVGEFIGYISPYQNNLAKLELIKEIKLNDRIRITTDKDYYIDVLKLLNINNKEVNSLNKIGYLPINFKLIQKTKLYIIKNRNFNYHDINKIPLNVYLTIKDNNILANINYDDIYLNYEACCLEDAKTRGLSKDDILKQFNKLNDTPFYLNILEVDSNIRTKFMPVSKINQLRRDILDVIYKNLQQNRRILDFKKPILEPFIEPKDIVCTCMNDKQYEVLKNLGFKVYYKDNYSSYLQYKTLKEDDVLVSNYGSIDLNLGKNIILNKEFNCLNHDSLAFFLKYSKSVTLSQELSFKEIKDLVLKFKEKYNFYPNTTLIIYGHMTLMTTKYCPLKHLNLCGECKNNKFFLADDTASFPLIHENCNTLILNGKPLNLIDEIDLLHPYITHFRLDFTIENEIETKEIALKALNKLKSLTKTDYFNPNKETRGYFKREIL